MKVGSCCAYCSLNLTRAIDRPRDPVPLSAARPVALEFESTKAPQSTMLCGPT